MHWITTVGMVMFTLFIGWVIGVVSSPDTAIGRDTYKRGFDRGYALRECNVHPGAYLDENNQCVQKVQP